MSYNLLDEPWIPVAGHEPVSLQAIFSDESLRHLGGNPVEKISVMNLLLAISQAACTPDNEEEWRQLGADLKKIWRTMSLLPQITPGSFRIIWG